MVVSMRNEPAFPNEGFNGWGEPFQGMTLRDYFAAQAMLGYMHDCYDLDHKERAAAAYEQADSMLAERQK